MVRLLERLARAESPSVVPRAQHGAFALLAAELARGGYHVRAVPGDEAGDHLYARPRERRRGVPWQLVVGHMDTVWPLGTLAEMPVRRADDRLYGPGVYDMKAGLVELVFAVHAIAAHRVVPEVTPVVVVNTDEEVGSGDSGRIIRRVAGGAERAFVLEPGAGRKGKLKTARKGVARFQLDVTGRAAHAGSEPEHGVSAILELSRQIERLFALNDPERGVTVNVGTIGGGLRPNVIAPEASALIDVRVANRSDAAVVERAIRSLTPVEPGATLSVSGGFGRPPMEATLRNRALYRRARALGCALGLELEEAPVVGGASDGNTTSLYTATLDGLGPIGDGAHAEDEHVVISRLPERAALLALLLLEPPFRPASAAESRGRSSSSAARMSA